MFTGPEAKSQLLDTVHSELIRMHPFCKTK